MTNHILVKILGPIWFNIAGCLFLGWSWSTSGMGFPSSAGTTISSRVSMSLCRYRNVSDCGDFFDYDNFILNLDLLSRTPSWVCSWVVLTTTILWVSLWAFKPHQVLPQEAEEGWKSETYSTENSSLLLLLKGVCLRYMGEIYELYMYMRYEIWDLCLWCMGEIIITLIIIVQMWDRDTNDNTDADTIILLMRVCCQG